MMIEFSHQRLYKQAATGSHDSIFISDNQVSNLQSFPNHFTAKNQLALWSASKDKSSVLPRESVVLDMPKVAKLSMF